MKFKVIWGIAKDWFLALGITLAVFGAWRVMTPGLASTGPAPALELRTTDGGSIDLATLDNEVVIVNFWATWCGPCRGEIPEFAAFYEQNPDIPILGVSVDRNMDTHKLGLMSKRLGINYPVLHDYSGAVANAWGVTAFPTTFVLDAQHQIIASHSGPLNRRHLEHYVAQVRED